MGAGAPSVAGVLYVGQTRETLVRGLASKFHFHYEPPPVPRLTVLGECEAIKRILEDPARSLEARQAARRALHGLAERRAWSENSAYLQNDLRISGRQQVTRDLGKQILPT